MLIRKIKLDALIVLMCMYALNVHAKSTDECMAKAYSQIEMNQCAGLSLKAAEQELERVSKRIEEVYANDENFLKMLEKSQSVWKESVKAEMDLMFPAPDKQKSYGSVYPLCASGFKLRLTLQRIEYLKAWLKGHSGDNACSGSIMHEYCINNEC